MTEEEYVDDLMKPVNPAELEESEGDESETDGTAIDSVDDGEDENATPKESIDTATNCLLALSQPLAEEDVAQDLNDDDHCVANAQKVLQSSKAWEGIEEELGELRGLEQRIDKNFYEFSLLQEKLGQSSDGEMVSERDSLREALVKDGKALVEACEERAGSSWAGKASSVREEAEELVGIASSDDTVTEAQFQKELGEVEKWLELRKGIMEEVRQEVVESKQRSKQSLMDVAVQIGDAEVPDEGKLVGSRLFLFFFFFLFSVNDQMQGFLSLEMNQSYVLVIC